MSIDDVKFNKHDNEIYLDISFWIVGEGTLCHEKASIRKMLFLQHKPTCLKEHNEQEFLSRWFQNFTQTFIQNVTTDQVKYN